MQVLVADDDAVSLRLLQAHLQKWGYEVCTAGDGIEAWRHFERGSFPLVLTDWMMPGLDGLELVRRIRACERPGYVYVILLTARAEKQDVVQGMEAGADDFVTKPFDRDELRVRLRAGERIIHLEHHLHQTRAALVQSEKQAGLGRLAAGMAHEVNNPVAFVSNNLVVLRRDLAGLWRLLDAYREGRGGLSPERAAQVARLEEEIDLAYVRGNLDGLMDRSLAGLKRVRDIVANLRDFARLDEAELKEADLNAGLTATLAMLHHEIDKKGVAVRTSLGPLPPVRCQPAKVNQVFLNVLLNALQAVAPGGTIDVRSRAESPGAVIEVEDNGTGIAPEHLPRIFDPFFTTRPPGQGTGLGLAVCYGIVREHGGTLEARSTVGKGTTLFIRLPARPSKPAP